MQLDVVLCDHGQVAGDKLFISGGGINHFRVGETAGPYVVSFGVAGTVTVPPTEAAGDHVLSLRVEHANGEPARLYGDADGRTVGGELRLVGNAAEVVDDQTISFAFNFQSVPFAALGSYVVVCSVDGAETRVLRFQVASDGVAG